MLLTVFDLLLILVLFDLELLSKLVDFLFLLVEDLVFLFFVVGSSFLPQIILDLSDIGVVSLNHFLHLSDFLVHLLEFSVVLLDSVLKAFPCFWEGQVHFVGLQLQVLLLLQQIGPLFLQVLCPLLERILPESGFGLDESRTDLLQLVSGVVDLLLKQSVLLLQLFVFVTLFRIQIVESRLVLVVDLLNL